MDSNTNINELTLNTIGVTQGILDSVSDEETVNNYFDKVINPLCSAIADENAHRQKLISKLKSIISDLENGYDGFLYLYDVLMTKGDKK